MKRPDPALAKLVHQELTTAPTERVLFVDTDNQIREAVYRSEFGNGVIQAVRHRLSERGVLKAVVHVSRNRPTRYEPRHTTVEVVDSGSVFDYVMQPPVYSWDVADETTREEVRKFMQGEEESDS